MHLVRRILCNGKGRVNVISMSLVKRLLLFVSLFVVLFLLCPDLTCGITLGMLLFIVLFLNSGLKLKREGIIQQFLY